ncbi:alpha/beta fold hydrolase [Pseudomonas sp. GD03944]|uniref:alpha/beta fold hydrolase n=1 Tax=Pseudomonas sp. GD03944 TaxID=2975409 RepID=UPI00244BCF00|nr:alpha/beta fold hydrolase [Pseudomonas sp. GD03944]MDH1263301.1 alpha/beta hydrolase [Pseudomonas sp. GD03944]
MHPFSFDAMDQKNVPTCLGVLRVRSAGQGEPILFWSSLLMSSGMWQAQAQHFSANYRVILIDPPGHGDSQDLTQGFTFEQCARCVVEVLDALGIRRAHFVGNSWGGMIGGTFAARYPERVGAAVLMNCTASAAGLRHRLEFPVLAAISKLLGGMHGPLMGPVIRAFAGPTSRRQRPQVVEAIREAVGRCRVHSVAWAVSSVVPRRPDQRALMGQIRTPVLVVAGEEDQTFAVAETRAMAEAIPGAEFVVLKDTAHLAALENPEVVNPLIAAFLARHPLAE